LLPRPILTSRSARWRPAPGRTGMAPGNPDGALTTGVLGLNRRAALGMRSTLHFSIVTTSAVAVMPGRSVKSWFCTARSATYATTVFVLALVLLVLLPLVAGVLEPTSTREITAGKTRPG